MLLEGVDRILPCELQCESVTKPLAIQTDRPRFSWRLLAEGRGRRQTAYRVMVADQPERLEAGEGLCWDSGKTYSDHTFDIVYGGSRLDSASRYYWRVVAWDEEDREGLPSEISAYDTGLLERTDWSASWIGAPEASGSPLFRREIDIEQPCVRAIAYIACLGYGELYVDGAKAGERVLDPHWSDYDDRTIEGLLYPYQDAGLKSVYYVAHDLTAELTPGRHVLGLMVGNGWYRQTARTVEGQMAYGIPRVLLQVHLHYADGSAVRILTDETWRCAPGPIVSDQLFVGEVYDARLEQPGWCEPGFDDSPWACAQELPAPSGRLRAQLSPADQARGTLRPIRRWTDREGGYLFDLGQNISGWVRLCVVAPRGARIVMRFAEELGDDGALDYDSAGGVGQIQRDVYIAKGEGVERYEPRFVWHGFRYVEVTGLVGEPTDDTVLGVVVHAAVEQAGEFECSDERLNRIQELYRWSQLTNLHSGVPSDCPHRERLGYTGDGHVTAQAAIYNFGMAAFYRKWIQDIADAQHQATGFVPHTAPFNGGGGGPGWGSAYVILCWQLYRAYGDRSVLEAHYEGMARWAAYLRGCTDDGCIVVREEPGSWCLGDWCIPGELELPEQVVNTYFHAEVNRLLGQIAHVLGKTEDGLAYERRFADICRGYNEAFLDCKRLQYSIGRQGADFFAYALGCVPEDIEPAIRQRLLTQYSLSQGGAIDTGIFGTPLLLEALADWGAIDQALELALSDEYPGYGYMLRQGATTLWERWDGLESHNHPMFGSISAWMFERLAGLRMCEDAVAFGRVRVQPPLRSRLASARATLSTIRGRYAVWWERVGERFVIELAVPPNGAVELVLPGVYELKVAERGEPLAEGVDYRIRSGRIALGSGDYRIEGRLTGEEVTAVR
ncbi:alpha-L-rhamnosidase [Paenibacillus sp. 598K]|uniref:alpha-L-rhamnosidase n=1 Tax=Paenibacillus sp. 598K TaxID=1117987 RepID=UPI00162706CC|nr:alpha-L-rhamnosidase [Paenibacillus sp. 598K]